MNWEHSTDTHRPVTTTEVVRIREIITDLLSHDIYNQTH
jgi:hypothetical protein